MHEPINCVRDIRNTHYIGKGYTSPFTCPTCKRTARFHLGFLGRRNVVCNGVKFTKVLKVKP